MITEETKDLIYYQESRKKMTPIQKLVDDLYWDYDRMSSSGQKTLDKLFDKVFNLCDLKNNNNVIVLMTKSQIKVSKYRKD